MILAATHPTSPWVAAGWSLLALAVLIGGILLYNRWVQRRSPRERGEKQKRPHRHDKKP